MPSVTEERRRQIENLENEIETDVKWIDEEKAKLNTTLKMVEDVPETTLDQLSRSASSSTSKRNRGETVEISETRAMYNTVINGLRDAIRGREEKLKRLRTEKRDLESYDRGA